MSNYSISFAVFIFFISFIMHSDAQAFEELHRFDVKVDGHAATYVSAPVFSPDGRHIAVIVDQKSVQVIDTFDGWMVATLTTENKPQQLAFSPNGKAVAVGTVGGNILLWDFASAKPTKFVTEAEFIYDLEFSPQGTRILFLYKDAYGLNLSDGMVQKINLEHNDAPTHRHKPVSILVNDDLIVFKLEELTDVRKGKNWTRPHIYSLHRDDQKWTRMPAQFYNVSVEDSYGIDMAGGKIVIARLSGPQVLFLTGKPFRWMSGAPASLSLYFNNNASMLLQRKSQNIITITSIRKRNSVSYDLGGGISGLSINNKRNLLATISHSSVHIWKLPDYFSGTDVPDEPVQTSSDRTSLRGAIDAVVAGDADTLRDALAAGALTHTSDPSILSYAAILGTPELLQIILEAGAEIDETAPSNSWTALMHAAAAGNSSTTSALLEKRASTMAIGALGATFTSLLLKSAIQPDDGTLAGSLKADALRLVSGRAAKARLAEAAAAGNMYDVATLIDLGVDANGRDMKGRSPLMHVAASNAAQAGRVIKHLVQIGGADLNARANDGSTALGIAIAASRDKAVLKPLASWTNLEAYKTSDGRSYASLARKVSNEVAMAMIREKLPPLTLPKIAIPKVKIRLSYNMTRNEVRAAQRTMRDLGIYKGAIDGLWGPNSRRGLAAYFKSMFDTSREHLLRSCRQIAPDVLRHYVEGGKVGTRIASGGKTVHVVQSGIFNSSGKTNAPSGGLYSCKFEIKGQNVSVYGVDFYDGYTSVDFLFFEPCTGVQSNVRASASQAGYIIASDNPCKREISGVPLAGEGIISRWRKY